MAEAKHYDCKDLIQCGICLLTLHDPKALPCLHSFCMKCLSQWAKGKTKVTCPLCVQEFGIPSGGVSAFRTNFFINTLKEQQENTRTLQSKDTLVPCSSCVSLESKVKGYCCSCGGFICEDCVGIHGKIKNLSNHKVIPYIDLQSGMIDIKQLRQKKYCTVHEEQVLRFFCETCGELICRDCTVVDHPAADHTLVNLENATKGQKREMENLSRSCETIQKEIEDALKQVDIVSEQLIRNATKAEEGIDIAFNRVLRLVEDNRNKLKGEVQTIVLERKKQIETEIDKLQLQQTRLVTTLQMATEVVQRGSDFDLALVYSSLKTNLTKLRDMKPAPSKKYLGYVTFEPAQASQQATLNLGSILTRRRRVNEGVGVWKLESRFGNHGDGCLSSGCGVSITHQGDLAIADQHDPSFKFYNRNGDFKSEISARYNPFNIATATEDGRMFVTDQKKYVSVYGVEGNRKYWFRALSPDNESTSSHATLCGLAFDNHNNLLVGVSDNHVNQLYISKHRIDGTHVTSVKVTIAPWCIAVSPQDKVIVSSWYHNAVHILHENGTHLHTLKPPQGLSTWIPYGVCCTSDNEVYLANRDSGHDSPGSIHSYSTKTGDYIGCLTKDVTSPSGLALIDNEEKLIVVENKSVKIFELQ